MQTLYPSTQEVITGSVPANTSSYTKQREGDGEISWKKQTKLLLDAAAGLILETVPRSDVCKLLSL